jgi:DNA-binding transcriptional LysR family regulator
VQEGFDQNTIVSLVAAGIGVSVVNSATRHRRPDGVAVRPLVDLSLPLPLDLVWRRDRTSAALAAFVALLQG